jgi:hypothetical protein
MSFKLGEMNPWNVLNLHYRQDVYPTNGHDICNYMARHGMANFQIQTLEKIKDELMACCDDMEA